MKGALSEWRSGVGKRFVWVEFEQYARRVFAGSPEGWYQNPVKFASTVAQAQQVIQTAVLSIEVTAPYLENGVGTVGASSPAEAVQSLLAEPAPAAFVTEVVDALAHQFSDRLDLVMKLRSPRDLLIACGAPTESEPEFDDLDDVGTALANFVRLLSNKPFAGLQIASSQPEGMSADELEACEPLIRAARYYDWAVILGLETCSSVDLPDVDADLLLLPEAPGDVLSKGQHGTTPIAGGLGSQVWLGAKGMAISQDVSVLYGIIPPDAHPETVVDRARNLGAA